MSKLIRSRKGEHIDICVNEDVNYSYNFFDDIEFVHDALTDVNYDDIDTSTTFIKHHLKHPFMITAMTGGYPEAKTINKRLAALCEKYGIAFGLGSQRAMIENKGLTETYYVRDVAKTIPIVGNIGAAQLFQYDSTKINDALKSVDADYLAIHLNTLQELVQPEGDRRFAGLKEKIESVCREIEYPVILKETGAGIDRSVVKRFAGWRPLIAGVDIAGRGGTSWSKVEEYRGGIAGPFGEWGNPTPACVMEVANTGIFTIASGGVRHGLDAAKAFALGADVAGAARPFISAYFKGKLDEEIELWITYLKRAMVLTNSGNMRELGRTNVIITGRLADYIKAKSMING